MIRFRKLSRLISLVACFSIVGTIYLYVHITKERSADLPWWHWDAEFDAANTIVHGEEVISLESRRMTAKELKGASLSPAKSLIFASSATLGIGRDYTFSGTTCGGDCFVTFNSSFRAASDAVIYNCVDMRSDYEEPLPSRSLPSQLFIFFCMENPWITKRGGGEKISFDRLDGIFNMTMSYRSDSDIHTPCSTRNIVLQSLPQYPSNFQELLSIKSGHSVWIVNNCRYTKGAMHRMTMAKKLQNAGLEVDFFGSCFRSFPEPARDKISKYKFYLSFENSFHCKEYITEKVWMNGLKAGAVPVVWGPRRSDLERHLPPNSYIFVENFASPQNLVEYLDFLNKNDAEYAKFFDWRFHPEKFNKPDAILDDLEIAMADDILRRAFCSACKVLNVRKSLKSNGRRIVKSINDWWYGEEEPVCIAPWTSKDISNYFAVVSYLV